MSGEENITYTANHEIGKPARSKPNWDQDWHALVDQLEEKLLTRDVDSAKSDYEPYDGTLFFATDTENLYQGTGNEWSRVESSGGNPTFGHATADRVTINDEPTSDTDAVRQQDLDEATAQAGIGGQYSATGDGSTTTFSWDTGVSDPADISYVSIDASSEAASTDHQRFIDGTTVGVEYATAPADGASLSWYWAVNASTSALPDHTHTGETIEPDTVNAQSATVATAPSSETDVVRKTEHDTKADAQGGTIGDQTPVESLHTEVSRTATEPVANVKHHGAVGDGATDDLSALEAAVSALPDSGGVVYLPPGDYLVSDTWQIPKDIGIRGDGDMSCITTESPLEEVISHDGSGYRLSDFRVDGTLTAARGIVQNGYRKTVDNVTVENLTYIPDGSAITTPVGIRDYGGESEFNNCTTNNIVGLEEDDGSWDIAYPGSARGILSATGGSGHHGNVKIANCTFENIRYNLDGDGVVVGVNHSSDVHIVNNHFKNVHKSDVKIQGSGVRDVVVDGNTSVFDNGSIDDTTEYSKYGFIRIQTPEATVTGNRCRIDRGTIGGFLRTQCSEVSFIGNTCILGSYDSEFGDVTYGTNVDGSFDGISIFGDGESSPAVDVTAEDNKIVGPVRFGAYLLDGVTNTKLSDNLFKGNTNHCILAGGTANGDFVSIVDNTIRDSGNNAIRLQSGGPYIIDGNITESENGLINAEDGVEYILGTNEPSKPQETYIYAGDCTGTTPDERLGNAVDLAESGDTIHLESELYTNDHTISKTVRLTGTNHYAGTHFEGNLTLNGGISLRNLQMSSSVSVTAASDDCRFKNIWASSNTTITVQANRAMFSEIRGFDVTFESGTSDGRVTESCVDTSVTDNGSNYNGTV